MTLSYDYELHIDRLSDVIAKRDEQILEQMREMRQTRERIKQLAKPSEPKACGCCGLVPSDYCSQCGNYLPDDK